MRRPVSNRRRLSVEPLERRLMLFNGFNPHVTLVTNVGDIEFELFEDNAPGTVDNFLNYVNDGDYINSFFHRWAPDFVLQGGGFQYNGDTFCPVDSCSFEEIDGSLFSHVPTDDPIVNEFDIPNTRGTVATAKLGGDPDSATSQFFINLGDNRANLDNQNGGFTVFAQVVDLTVIDEIVALNSVSHGANFSNVFDDPTIGGAFSSPTAATPYHVTDDGFRWVTIQEVTGTSLAHGTVFFDSDSDGTFDSSESGRGGITVFDDANQNGVLDAGELSTTTRDNGDYHLTFEGGHTYNLVMTDGAGWTQTGQTIHAGSLELGHSEIDLDFGTRFTVAAWHNPSVAEDVDGVSGVAPLDALQIINELNSRNFSDPVTADLTAASIPTDQLFFPDVNDDGKVTPNDALIVINRLNASTPAAALSASVDLDINDNDDEGTTRRLDPSVVDSIFGGDFN